MTTDNEKDMKTGDTQTTSNGDNGTKTEPEFPGDHVVKLTEHELLLFNNMRLQQENKLQAIRVLELEEDRARREFRDQQHTREVITKQHRESHKLLEASYWQFIRELAEKYKLDPNKMGIDDETGVLRDLRDEESPPS